MKNLIKLAVAIQVLVVFVFVFGCSWVVCQVIGQELPLMILPYVMAISFAATLLAFIAAPALEWWMA